MVEANQVFRDLQGLFKNLFTFFKGRWRWFKPTWLFFRFLLIFLWFSIEFINLFKVDHSRVQNLRPILSSPIPRNLENLISFGRNTQNIPVDQRLLFLHPFSSSVKSGLLQL